MRSHKLTVFFCLVLFATLFIVRMALADNLTMAFVPGNSPQNLIQKWEFLIRRLGTEIGIPINMSLHDNYSDITESLMNGSADLLEGGIYYESTLMKQGLIEPLVGERRMGRLTYRSAIVVRKDSPIQNLSDLKGKAMGFTDSYSTSGYLMPRLFFQQQGISNLNEYFSKVFLLGSQDRALNSLMNHFVDAVAVGDVFIDYYPKEVREKIRVIHYSEAYPFGFVACRKDLDPKLKQDITTALLGLHNKVAFETLKKADIDSFVPLDPTLLKKSLELPEFAKTLTPVRFDPTPRFVDDALTTSAQQQGHRTLWKMAALTSVLILILLATTLLHKRPFRKFFLIFVCTPLIILAAVVTILDGYLAQRNLEDLLLPSIERSTQFHRDILGLLEQGQLPTQSLVTQYVGEDPLIVALRIFRQNSYVIDSTNLSLGKSIIDNVLSGTFDLKNPEHSNEIETIDAIWHKNKIWGNLQMLIDFGPVHSLTGHFFIIHIFILMAVLLLSVLLSLVLSRSFMAPLSKISASLNKLKQADGNADHGNTINLSALAHEIAHVSLDLEEKQKFLTLKDEQIALTNTNAVPEKGLSLELSQKIMTSLKELESRHPAFKHLRQTELIGNSPEFLKMLMNAIIRSKDTDPVLIFGPTGSGKTGIAKAIHALSHRRQLPLAEFNCAEFASADPLIVLGKLFGYGKNSGLHGIPPNGLPGLLEQNAGGTIFFDEVEHIPPQAQRLLLLPLEGRPINPAAGMGPSKQIDIRYIFATNEDLSKPTSENLIRQDFYRRLINRGTIIVPPLSQRKEDVELLARHFLSQWNRVNQKSMTMSEDFWQALREKDFCHHNISELKSLITITADRAAFSEDAVLTDAAPSARDDVAIFSDEKPDRLLGAAILLDAEEWRELQALQKHQFNIAGAEAELNYSSKAKTLSNHFRGLCYKLLCTIQDSQGKLDENLLMRLTRELSGSALTDYLSEKIKRKILRYHERLMAADTTESKARLLNNLPVKYVASMEKLLGTRS